MRHLLRRFINDQSGVTAIEYGLIAVSTLGTNLTTVFTQVAGSLT